MRKVWAAVIAILLASAIAACSKCDVPDLTHLVPKFCKSGGQIGP